MYYRRPEPTMTLGQLNNELDELAGGAVQTLDPEHTNIALDGSDLVLNMRPLDGPAGPTSVRVGQRGLEGLSHFLDIPSTWTKKVRPNDPEFLAHVLNHFLSAYPGNFNVRVSGELALNEVFDPAAWRIDPRALVEVTQAIIHPDALVIDWHKTNAEFGLDTTVPPGFDRMTETGLQDWVDLEDGQSHQVGDLTRGGLRIGMGTTTTEMAPWVQPYTYRLVCTNGMECMDDTLKIDAKGADVEEVMLEFEMTARRAFERVEAVMAGLEDLRRQPVPDLSQAVLAISREHNLPDRTRMEMVERVPVFTAELAERGEQASMATLVDLITNEANSPHVPNRVGSRRALERAGGAVVNDHADRCPNCLSRVTSN